MKPLGFSPAMRRGRAGLNVHRVKAAASRYLGVLKAGMDVPACRKFLKTVFNHRNRRAIGLMPLPASERAAIERRAEIYLDRSGSRPGSPVAERRSSPSRSPREKGGGVCPVCYDKVVDRVLDCGHTICRVCWGTLRDERCHSCRAITTCARPLFLS